jgi:hypothetical protein
MKLINTFDKVKKIVYREKLGLREKQSIKDTEKERVYIIR